MRTGLFVSVAVVVISAVGFPVLYADVVEFGPCNPEPVSKRVKIVRREIKVAVIGMDRIAMPKNRRPKVQDCIDYWIAGMDREISNKPDLVVLPEGVDSHWGATPAEKRSWIERRGNRILTAFQAYAKRHGCYLVFNSWRQRTDGKFANCTFTIDRVGDVVGVYDKVYPAPYERYAPGLPVIPGEKPVVIDTDFGTMGFITCYDLNFTDLLHAYAKKRPDVMVFCSAFNGDFFQRTWSYLCRSHLIAATVGSLEKDVWGPSGEEVYKGEPSHYGPFIKGTPDRSRFKETFTVRINTNCRVVHLDGGVKPLKAAVEKYKGVFSIRNPGAVGCVTVLSSDPSIAIDRIVKEFKLLPWDEYYAASVKARGGEVKTE